MQITFYVLETTVTQQAWLFVCKLVESLYVKQQNIHISTQDINDAKRIDQLLWTFRDDSFLPHALATEDKSDSPILIFDMSHFAPSSKQVLVNLSHDIFPSYQDYAQLIEIVYSEPTAQQQARMRYKKYRDQGHQIKTIKQQDTNL